METYIIKNPSGGAIDILLRRAGTTVGQKATQGADAVGLVQGRMIEMIPAADIAEKTSGVTVADIRGSCPQNMILLAIFGDTASVEEAILRIEKQLRGGKNAC